MKGSVVIARSGIESTANTISVPYYDEHHQSGVAYRFPSTLTENLARGSRAHSGAQPAGTSAASGCARDEFRFPAQPEV